MHLCRSGLSRLLAYGINFRFFLERHDSPTKACRNRQTLKIKRILGQYSKELSVLPLRNPALSNPEFSSFPQRSSGRGGGGCHFEGKDRDENRRLAYSVYWGCRMSALSLNTIPRNVDHRFLQNSYISEANVPGILASLVVT